MDWIIYEECFYWLVFVIYCVRKVNVGTGVNGSSVAKEENAPHQQQPNGSQQESKLELFGFDSLVNILGLKRYMRLATVNRF